MSNKKNKQTKQKNGKKISKKAEIKTFSFNPIDVIRINAIPSVRKNILEQPSYCHAYIDCIELRPEAKALVADLRREKDNINITLDSPVDTEISRLVAQKFDIPYTNIQKSRANNKAQNVYFIETKFKKQAS